MAKDKITDYSATAASNTDIGGVNIQGTAAVSNIDNAMREQMSHLAETNAGTYPVDDTWTFCDPADRTKKFRFDGVGVTAGQTRVVTIPDSDGTIMYSGGVLTTPQINDTSSDHQYVFAVSELAADRTVTLPLLTTADEFVFKDHAVTMTNKTLTSPTITAGALTDPVITGAVKEDVYTITDGDAFEIDPGNGTIQTITLGASRTPAATNFASGESVTLRIADGTAYTITWTTVGVVWVGGSAPTLATSGYTIVELWKDNTTIYGAHVGDVAS